MYECNMLICAAVIMYEYRRNILLTTTEMFEMLMMNEIPGICDWNEYEYQMTTLRQRTSPLATVLGYRCGLQLVMSLLQLVAGDANLDWLSGVNNPENVS